MYRLGFVFIFIAFVVGGCGSGTGPDAGLLSYTKVIKASEINNALSQVVPISKRSTFGSFTISKAHVKPGKSGDHLVLSTGFSLTTFEIPEGVDGSLGASCGLRYEPKTKQILLTDISPGSIYIGNKSLREYVGSSVEKGITDIVKKVFTDLPVYKMDESFTAKFIKKIAVDNGDIVIVYGL